MSDSLTGARLDIGRVISLTFGIIGRNAVSILLICLLGTLASMGLAYLVSVGTAGIDPSVRAILTQVVSLVLNLATHAIMLGSVTYIAVSDLNGQRPGAGAALSIGLRLFLPVIGINLLVSLGAGLASILLVVPGILLLLRWFVAIPVRVLEGPGIGRALSRSGELTIGHRWKLFGLFVIYVVLSVLLLGVGFLINGGFVRTAQLQASFDPLALTLQVISTVILTAISTTGVASLYTELRRIREGALPNQLASVFA